MIQRVNPFENLQETLEALNAKDVVKDPVDPAVIDRMAEQHNFPSRQAPKTSRTPRRKPRLHRTGRTVQFNAKTTQEVIDRFYRICDEQRLLVAEGFEHGVDALELFFPLRELAESRKVPLAQILREALESLKRTTKV